MVKKCKTYKMLSFERHFRKRLSYLLKSHKGMSDRMCTNTYHLPGDTDQVIGIRAKWKHVFCFEGYTHSYNFLWHTMKSAWAAHVKAMEIKRNLFFSSLDVLFNRGCLHTELKVELRTMQFNYKLPLWGLLLQLIL